MPAPEEFLKPMRTLLSRWPGAHVRVHELTVSLRSLRIVVFRPGSGDSVLEIGAAGPLWFRGPLEWSDALLYVDLVDAATSPAGRFTQRERLFRLYDPIGFELYNDVPFSLAERPGPYREPA